MLSARAIAIQGFGYGALLVAVQGLLPIEEIAEPPQGIPANVSGRPMHVGHRRRNDDDEVLLLLMSVLPLMD